MLVCFPWGGLPAQSKRKAISKLWVSCVSQRSRKVRRKENFLSVGTSLDRMPSFLSKQGQISLIMCLYCRSKKNQFWCPLLLLGQVIAPGAAVETVETDTSAVHCKTLTILPLISKSSWCFEAESMARFQQLSWKQWEVGQNVATFCF